MFLARSVIPLTMEVVEQNRAPGTISRAGFSRLNRNQCCPESGQLIAFARHPRLDHSTDRREGVEVAGYNNAGETGPIVRSGFARSRSFCISSRMWRLLLRWLSGQDHPLRRPVLRVRHPFFRLTDSFLRNFHAIPYWMRSQILFFVSS